MSDEHDVSTALTEEGVGLLTFALAPHNHLNIRLLRAILDGLETLDDEPRCAVTVLRSQGRHFCAGRDFSAPRTPEDSSEAIYTEAARLFDLRKPWVALVQRGAIGSGMGLAVAADFRVAEPGTYFWPNFTRLGLHPGFGLSLTLPEVVGSQSARRMLYAGERVGASMASTVGLVDLVSASAESLEEEGMAFAARFAAVPSPAMESVRATSRVRLSRAAYLAAVARESAEQARLRPST